MTTKTKKKHVIMENFPVRQLRQRMFVKKSSTIFPNQEYTFLDDVPEQIEALKGFQAWESFGESWDILWVGFDPRTMQWVPGRHNSPSRETVTPITIVKLDDRTRRMEVPGELRQIISAMPLPEGISLVESDEDRAISEALSGRVVIDEPDEDKAIRAIEENMKQLMEQLQQLKSKK